MRTALIAVISAAIASIAWLLIYTIPALSQDKPEPPKPKPKPVPADAAYIPIGAHGIDPSGLSYAWYIDSAKNRIVVCRWRPEKGGTVQCFSEAVP